jgi:hypothetical protein
MRETNGSTGCRVMSWERKEVDRELRILIVDPLQQPLPSHGMKTFCIHRHRCMQFGTAEPHGGVLAAGQSVDQCRGVNDDR